MKAVKRTRTLKQDSARVSKHLHTLLDRAPVQHKAALQREVDALDTAATSVPEIESWYGYPLTLDWIVDVYFDTADATPYKVILDSGSSNLAVATSSCTNCGDAATSLSLDAADPSLCISVEYGSGSWSGVELASTYVALSSAVATDVTLAGITDQDEFFEGGSSYCGILGMAYEGIANSYSSSSCSSSSSSGKRSKSAKDARLAAPAALTTATTTTTSDAATPLMYALTANGVISENSFAVAMCGDDAVVSIGGVDSSMYTGDITYAETQMTFGEYYGYYLVYTSAVSVAGSAVTVTDVNKYGGLVVDTGTTLHYLPTATVKAIEAAVTAAAPTVVSTDFFSWTSCIAAADIASLPTVTYTFATSSEDDATTFDVVLEPAHYLLDYSDCYYWGFEASTLGIFGNIGMKGRVVHFDVTNNQVGFGAGVCAATDDAAAEEALDARARDRRPALAAAAAAAPASAELAAGGAAALAVVGTVLLSAFVAARKFAAPKAARAADESQSLLPVL
jgi:hypothetical protein